MWNSDMYIECKYSSDFISMLPTKSVQHSCIPSWVLLQQGLISWICARRLHLGKRCWLHQFKIFQLAKLTKQSLSQPQLIKIGQKGPWWWQGAGFSFHLSCWREDTSCKGGSQVSRTFKDSCFKSLVIVHCGKSELLRCRTNQVQALAVPCAQNEISLSLHLAQKPHNHQYKLKCGCPRLSQHV